MSGSKTILGFSGGDEPPPLDPEGTPTPGAARTIIGREIHRGAPPEPRPLATMLAKAREEAPVSVPQTISEDKTEELPPRPSHTGKSKFPPFARLFGRWTTEGDFLSNSQMSRADDDPLHVPREPWVSRVAIFVAAALLSFLVALAVLKVRSCRPSALQPPAAAQVSVPPAPPTPPVAAATGPPAPSAPTGAPAPESQAAAAPAPSPPVAQPPAVPPKAVHRSQGRKDHTSGRPAPGAPGKLHAQPTQPNPLQPGNAHLDSILPLGQ